MLWGQEELRQPERKTKVENLHYRKTSYKMIIGKLGGMATQIGKQTSRTE